MPASLPSKGVADPARPHIALFGDFEATGGASRTLANQIKYWVKWGMQVEIVGYRDATRFYSDELPDSVSFVHLGTRGRVTTTFALWRYLRRRRPAIILATTHLANLILTRIATLPLHGTQCWLSVHNNFVRSGRRTSAAQQRKIRQIQRHYPRAAGVITVSEGVRADLISELGLPPGLIHAAYNAVIDEEIRARAAQSVDHPWLTNKEMPVLISVGRLAHQKDFPTLLRAFALLRRTQACKLLILGEGPEREPLQAIVRELGIADDVGMPGFATNPYAIMARCDGFVLSSVWEGFGNVVAEALGLGLPVVATDCPSGPAEILGGGRYGRLVAVGDVPGLAQGMAEMLAGHNPSFDIDEAVAPYTSPVSARRYLEVFGFQNAICLGRAVGYGEKTGDSRPDEGLGWD